MANAPDPNDRTALPPLDTLWDFGDPEGSEGRFRERLAAVAGRPIEAAEAGTQLARSLGLQGRFDEAHAELDRAERLLEAGRGDRVRVRLLLERGRAHNSAGRRDEALPTFERALELAQGAGEDALAVDAAHMLALAAEGDARLAWGRRALALAEASDDPDARRWRASLHHNLGWELHDRGAFPEALAQFERALIEREEQGRAGPLQVARWSVARALRSLGRIDEALAGQRALLDAGAHEDGYVHEEIGECLLALGRPEEARAPLARAHALLSQDGWLRRHEAARLARLAELGGVEVEGG